MQKFLFDPNEIKIALDLPAPLVILQPFVKYLLKMLDHIQKPLFTLFKKFGKPIGEWLGFLLETTAVRLEEYWLETSDGAKMATDIYIPKEIFESKGKLKGPTMLIRLPYWKDLVAILGYFFASMGYVTVLQDIRGCAHSIDYGTNSFFTTEGIDGRETLRWISKRFWYNGKLGMWGISYLGITQLSLISDNEGLVTCFNPIQCSFMNMFWHPGGMYPIGMSGSVYLITKFITEYRDLPPLNMRKWDPKGHAWTLFFNPFFSLYNEPMDTGGFVKKLSDLGNMTKLKYQLKIMNQLFDTNVVINKKDDGSYDKLLDAVFYNRVMKHDHKLLPFSFGTTFKFDKTPILMIGGWYDMFIEETLVDLKEI